MNYFNKKTLSAAVSAVITLSIGANSSSYASDVEIYANSTPGKLTVFLMFDTSGSMGAGFGYDNNTLRNSASSLVQDYNICSWSGNTNSAIKSQSLTFQIGTRAAKSYTVNYCEVNQQTYNGLNSTYKTRIQNECEKNSATTTYPYRCYDRLSRLKKAMVTVLSDASVPSTARIGLGQFSIPTTTSTYSHDAARGRIIYPVVELTEVNRENLLTTIVGLNAFNGTPSAVAYAEAASYMLGVNNSDLTYSGVDFAPTNLSIYDANKKYNAPLTDTERNDQCNGQGIYFLTDGYANNSRSTITENLMKRALGTNTLSGTGLSGDTNINAYLINNTYVTNQGWSQIGRFAKLLRTDKKIKTAVVGFGSLFPNGSNYVKQLKEDPEDTDTKPYYDCSLLPSGDLRNTCNWGAKTHSTLAGVGGYGDGGFYSAQSEQDIIDSLLQFLKDNEPKFDPVATGSPSIPVDSLNPLEMQGSGYYASFVPKPQETTQLWAGNLNKYRVKGGELYSAVGTETLFTATGTLNNRASGFWANGAKGLIPIGTTATLTTKRSLFTNRKIESNAAVVDSTLTPVDFVTLFDADATKAKLKNDPDKNYWLNALGYPVSTTATGLTVATLPTANKRITGAIMHSSPLLLTQEGKIDVDSSGNVITTGREDYLLFGTTQGALHVVKAGGDNDIPQAMASGEEVFTFIPHEMMVKQKAAFVSEDAGTSGVGSLYYGIDAPWVSYTQYISKADGTLTVKDSGRTEKDENNADLSLKGLQWVYGGLRMGGRSYYALDVSNITTPTLKFHINPDAATSGALSHMGQSWSKPTIGYVNWSGSRRLVMFVGGGYDASTATTACNATAQNVGYECAKFNPTSPTKGAGVYMFDANNGELLWWTSAHISDTDKSSPTATGEPIAVRSTDIKYSVVSQINAFDRDGDGLIDNLYFGDLGGQGFRIDLNNNATANGAFTKRVVKLFSENVSTGLSPRFYEMPSVSIHNGVNGLYAVAAFSSGNRSSPLASATQSANDAVYAVYDNDVGRSNLYDDITLSTPATGSLVTLTPNSAVPQKTATGAYNLGWKYIYSTTVGRYKGMNELYALDNMLYVNVYDRDGTGTSAGGSCGGGVKGDSYLYQFCLPLGQCPFTLPEEGVPNRIKLGAGILGTGLGLGYGDEKNTVSLVTKRPTTLDCGDDDSKNLPECQLFTTKPALKQLRWYETR